MVENSVIANLLGAGVNVNGSGSANIVNSIIRSSGDGVLAINGANVTLANSKMLGNSVAIWAHSLTATTTTATISDTFFAGNAEAVVSSTDNAAAVSQAFVTRSTIEGATFPLECVNNVAGGSALITLNASTVVRNGLAFYQVGTGSVINTMGNNQITNNGSPTGSLTQVGLQ
jgi:hypothetical protein